MELRLTQRNVMAINLLLGVLLAYAVWLCVNDVLGFSAAGPVAKPHSRSAPAPIAAGPKTRAYYDAIVKRDIFNLVPPPVAAAPPVENEDLNLILIGTSHLAEAKPYAVIEDSSHEQSLYQLGDKVPKGTPVGTIAKVERTRVIIDHNGHLDAIEMPKIDLSGTTPSGLNTADHVLHRPVPARQRPGLRRRGFGRGGPRDRFRMKTLGPGRFSADRGQVMTAMADPATLLRQIQASPKIVDGKTTGYIVDSVVPGSVFDRLGLHGGDTITAIDGKPITSNQQGMAFLQSIPTRSSIDMTVSRNGASIPLHLDLH